MILLKKYLDWSILSNSLNYWDNNLHASLPSWALTLSWPKPLRCPRNSRMWEGIRQFCITITVKNQASTLNTLNWRSVWSCLRLQAYLHFYKASSLWWAKSCALEEHTARVLSGMDTHWSLPRCMFSPRLWKGCVKTHQSDVLTIDTIFKYLLWISRSYDKLWCNIWWYKNMSTHSTPEKTVVFVQWYQAKSWSQVQNTMEKKSTGGPKQYKS